MGDEITLFCARCEHFDEGTSLTVHSHWEARERYRWSCHEPSGEWYCEACTEVLIDQQAERRLI